MHITTELRLAKAFQCTAMHFAVAGNAYHYRATAAELELLPTWQCISVLPEAFTAKKYSTGLHSADRVLRKHQHP